MNRIWILIVAGLVAFSSISCSDNPDINIGTSTGSTATTVTINSVQITPVGPVSTPVASAPQQLTAQALDSSGNVLQNISFVWSSSSPTVASVTSTGLVTPLSPGTTTITATAQGVTSNSVTFTVDCNGVPETISAMTAIPEPISTLATSAIAVTIQDCDPSTLPDVPDGTSVVFSLSPSSIGTMTSQASTVAGIATGTFTAGTGAGIATVTGTVGTLSSSVSVTVSPPGIGSIEFGSATPTVIGIKGGGQTENSIIVFLVKDENGQPVVDGTPVLFTLIGPMGTSTSTPTNSNQESLTFYSVSSSLGNATTTLLSGSVAGVVRIDACVDENANVTCDTGEIATSSFPASIGGGVPSATHFSIGRLPVNIIRNKLNEQSTVSAFIADRFGNFNILQGTSISFITEAGAIDRNDITGADGFTDVILRTQAPDPIDVDPTDPLNPIGLETYINDTAFGYPIGFCDGRDGGEPFEDTNNDGGFDDGSGTDPCEPFTDTNYSGYQLNEPNPRDGWVTVVGFTRGEEAFDDSNGNGVYDTGEPFVDNGGEPFVDANDNGIYDAAEAFTDANFNGSYDLGETFTDVDRGEPFLDVNNNGVWDVGEPFTDMDRDIPPSYDAAGFGNKIYDRGELYIDVDGNGEWTHGNGVWDVDTTIWTQVKLVFSEQPDIGPFTSRIIIDSGSLVATPGPYEYVVPNGGCADFRIFVSDINGNYISPDSQIDISNDTGDLFGGGNIDVGNVFSFGPFRRDVQICDSDSADTDPPEPSSLAVTITWTDQAGNDVEFALPLVRGTVD